MMVSIGEMRFSVRWAAFARGIPVGLADDLAAAAATLADNGFSPLPHVLHALEDLVSWRNPDDVVQLGPHIADCLLTAGAAVPSPVVINCPLLLAGYIAAANCPPVKLDWQTADGIAQLQIRETRITPSVSTSLLALDDVSRATIDLETGDLEASVTTGEHHRVDVDEVRWQQLRAITKLAFAPADDQGRLNGAGAGLNDAD